MKKHVVILFGGQSTEHDISRKSVMTFIENIDREIFQVSLVGITRKGQWLLFEGDPSAIVNDTWEGMSVKAYIGPDATEKVLHIHRGDSYEMKPVDVVLPVLHGLYGEDGSVQGLLELAEIPFVGCGVLASAVAMDKFYTKSVVEPLGIRQAKFVGVIKEVYDRTRVQETVEQTLGYPVFVKPSNAGSSIGVSKADNGQELDEAIQLAFKYDRKVLVEEGINGREVECAVLGNIEVMASDVGEILSEDDFYDFHSKYESDISETIVGAAMPEATRQEIRDSAVTIFKAIDGRGLSRVDFFIEDATGQVVFNEINTFPGFTPISMYPMLMAAAGIDRKKLITELIDLAQASADERGSFS